MAPSYRLSGPFDHRTSSTPSPRPVDAAPAWWQVDLGTPAAINRVSVWHRTDCCQDRLASASIVVSMTDDFSTGATCGALTDYSRQPETTSCNGLKGRYITVSQEGSSDGAVATICEFKAWGSYGKGTPGSSSRPPPPPPPEPTYTIFKFNLDPAGDHTGLRGWSNANSVQLAEITLYDRAGNALRSGLTCTNPGGDSPDGEQPQHACVRTFALFVGSLKSLKRSCRRMARRTTTRTAARAAPTRAVRTAAPLLFNSSLAELKGAVCRQVARFQQS